MPRRTNKTAAADATTVDTAADENYQTGQDFDAESNEADLDEDMVSGNQNDPFFGKFEVTATLSGETAKAAAFHGSQTVIFHVTRWKARSYTARAYVGTGDAAQSFVGGDSKNPTAAIKKVIVAMGQRSAEYAFDAEAAEKEQAAIPDNAGDNQPDNYIWQDTTTEEGQKLAALGQRMAEAEKLYEVAGQNERAGELAVGAIYNEARAVYLALGVNPTDKSDKSEAAVKSNAEWGAFVKRYAGNLPHVLSVLADPALRSRYGAYAAAPAYVVEAMPTVNRATTFERKVNEAVSGISTAKDAPGFAAVAIRPLFAEKSSAAEDGEPITATTRELWEAAAMQHETNLDKVAQARTKWEADVKKASDAGNSTPAFADKQAEVNNKIIGWLLGDTSPTDEEGRAERASAFEGGRLHRGLLGAWEKAVKEATPKTEEEQEQEKEATKTKTKAAAEEQGKGIALMSVSEAAEVVANTIMAHAEPQQIADALVEVIRGRLEARAKAAAEKQEAANNADAAA